MFLDSVSNSCFYFGWQNKNCLLFKFEFQVKISNLIGVLLFCSLCCAVLSQPCLTLCGPINYIPPSCSLHGILQARILEWVAMPFLSPEGRFFTTSATWEALFLLCLGLKKHINSSPASDVSWLMNRRDIKFSGVHLVQEVVSTDELEFSEVWALKLTPHEFLRYRL